MSKIYGTGIKWSTVDAPSPITGICESFTYRNADQIFEVAGEADIEGIVVHGRKGEIDFSSTPAGSVTALGVRAGAELTISGITGGKIIVMKSSAQWRRGSPMTMQGSATHYPTLGTSTGSISPGAITLARTAGPLQLPADKVWWGTESVAKGSLSGIVESLSIEETVSAEETENDDTGEIEVVVLHSYKGNATLEILTDDDAPAPGDSIDLFGGFRVTNSEYRWQKRGLRSVSVTGLLLPGITDA